MVTESHTAGQAFDLSNFTKIPTLPIEGGVTVQIRKNFLPDIEIVPYGTVYKTVQEVADFIVGYDAYLKRFNGYYDTSDAGIIDKNGYNVPVFEVRVSKDLILFDQNKDLITQEKQTVSVDGVNGPDIVLGSLSDVSTNGNWPTTFDFERK